MFSSVGGSYEQVKQQNYLKEEYRSAFDRDIAANLDRVVILFF